MKTCGNSELLDKTKIISESGNGRIEIWNRYYCQRDKRICPYSGNRSNCPTSDNS